MIVLSEVFFMNKSDSFLSRVKVKVAQSCLTFCNPRDYTEHGILQARILEWVAFPFFRGSSQPRDPRDPRSPTLQADSLPAEPQERPCASLGPFKSTVWH